MNSQDIVGALLWRYATKRFDSSRRISNELWMDLRKALVLSPSSLGLQLWRFMDVRDTGVRQKLREVSWGQPQITDASHLVVFTARRDLTKADVERHLGNVCALRGIPRASMDAYAEKIEGITQVKSPAELAAWLERQVYISLGVLISAAAMAGVDACPIEALQPDAYDEILGLKDSPYRTLCVLALGYRSDDPYAKEAKVRFPESEVIVTV